MKTTIYELLGMIKDDKAPKKIFYREKLWEYDAQDKDYWTISYDGTEWLFDEYLTLDILNDEVEILETTITIKDDKFTGWEAEAKCDDEKNLLVSNKIEKIDNSYYHLPQDEQYQLFKHKINEIIDYIQKEK